MGEGGQGGGGGGPGHTLGGGGPTTIEEMRLRRLAALSGDPNGSTAAAGGGRDDDDDGRVHVSIPLPQQTPPPPSSSFAPMDVDAPAAPAASTAPPPAIMVEDYDDAELQRALALSLMESENDAAGGGGGGGEAGLGGGGGGNSTTSGLMETTSSASAGTAGSSSGLAVATSGDGGATQGGPQSSYSIRITHNDLGASDAGPEPQQQPNEGLAQTFHSLMWDPSITTPEDRERWRNQGIDVGVGLWSAAAAEEQEAQDAAAPSSSSATAAAGAAASASASAVTIAASAPAAAKRPKSPPPPSSASSSSSSNNTPHPNLGPPSQWGLTQVHGGPCGVLAAVQAEMLRVLLFGRPRGSDDQEKGRGGDEYNLVCPTDMPSEDEDRSELKAVDRDTVRRALALAVGTILARAALVPSASESKSPPAEDGGDVDGGGACRVRIVLPSLLPPFGAIESAQVNDENDENDQEEHCPSPMDVEGRDGDDGDGDGENENEGGGDGTAAAAASAPNPGGGAAAGAYGGLTWDMLDPTTTTTSGGCSSCGLSVHTITLVPTSAAEDGGVTEEEMEQDEEDGPDSKRQKKKRAGSADAAAAPAAAKAGLNATNDATVIRCGPGLDDKVSALASAAASFLLRGDGGGGHEQDEQQQQQQQHQPPPLWYLHTTGGVLLLTLSLLATRTSPTIKSDMDDPNTTLTSQFGHSSQELINLLLTGRAVSNVFDGTMTIGGASGGGGGEGGGGEGGKGKGGETAAEEEEPGMVCRGVQSRPAVGYLTQLESMRYCEVGTYYKSPTFPIWVVGSQNHFTVLFGDALCMKETIGDALLERCRRAFKSVDTDENGFIPVASLGLALGRLDGVYVKVGGEGGVSSLAAALEVHGAGIILWDDFWKATSRLLTGASLQRVLQGDDGAGNKTGGADAQSQQQQQAPLLLTQYGEGASTSSVGAVASSGGSVGTIQTDAEGGSGSGASGHAMSDEELARCLAAEWGTADATTTGGTGGDTAATAASASAAVGGGQDAASAAAGGGGGHPNRQKSDEELARELQAQWDREDSYGGMPPLDPVATDIIGNVVTVNNNDESKNDDDDGDRKPSSLNSTQGEQPQQQQQKGSSSSLTATTEPTVSTSNTSSVDKKVAFATDTVTIGGDVRPPLPMPAVANDDGNTFEMYHYNGLRGGTLTAFRVTRLSPEDAVGASIALSQHGRSASRGGGDLEDVVRTKWQCGFDWGGKNPPFID